MTDNSFLSPVEGNSGLWRDLINNLLQGKHGTFLYNLFPSLRQEQNVLLSEDILEKRLIILLLALKDQQYFRVEENICFSEIS